MHRLRSRSIAVTLFCLGFSFCLMASDKATSPSAPATVRIGTFDSRVVALVYRNTPAWRAEVAAMYKELARAEETHDGAKAEEMKRLGPSRQHLAHQQVFSNGSIIDIFPQFQKALPEIAARRGVVIIVSKWELPYTNDSVQTVDVTDDIVALFSPDERTRKWIEGARKSEPIPLQNLVYDPNH